MTDLGFERPLYILPFDHRGSFQTGLFGWKGTLATFTEFALRRSVLAKGPVSLLNRAGAALDARSARLRDPVPGSLIPNFHVVAAR